MAVFFVAGVHGVGKTTACAKVAEILRIKHLTASQIIRAEKESAISKKTKVVADVNTNQRYLVEGIARAMAVNDNLLLDGHFTLHTPAGLTSIPVQVFKDMNIQGVVVFSDAPDRIAARMQARDGDTFSVEEIHLNQEMEISHSHLVTRTLDIPLVLLNAFDRDGLEHAVADWISVK